jgi:uncharacterized protein YndB with AHSA1/START domain
MKSILPRNARAVADVADGLVLASVEIEAPPERVFRALVSKEVIAWWFKAFTFNTSDWAGEVRVGGRWRASGVSRGQPHALEGKFVEIAPPRKLVHTWRLPGMRGAATRVAYLLDGIEGGTRLTLRHAGFESAESCTETSDRWEACLNRLSDYLSPEAAPRWPGAVQSSSASSAKSASTRAGRQSTATTPHARAAPPGRRALRP